MKALSRERISAVAAEYGWLEATAASGVLLLRRTGRRGNDLRITVHFTTNGRVRSAEWGSDGVRTWVDGGTPGVIAYLRIFGSKGR